jgi:hypothetical protein
MSREKRDDIIEDKLRLHGFDNDEDWEYGLISIWETRYDRYSMKLYKNDHGYWIILEKIVGCEREILNMGSLNNADDIINLRDALSKCS